MKTLERQKHVINAEGKSLGRLASEVAVLLRGKNKPGWQPHIDGGDFVEIENVEKIKVTGNKQDQKMYYHHSEYPGGLKEETYAERVSRKGHSQVVVDAVYNMLPDNKLRQHMMKRLTFKSGQ